MKKVDIKKWHEIESEIAEKNSELHAIINEISPDDKHTLLQVELNYGEFITATDDKNVSSYIQHPAFTANPQTEDFINPETKLPFLALQLTKVCEEFLPSRSDGIHSIQTYHPGELFFTGHASAVVKNLPWRQTSSITAGMRSAFMLPKISESRAHKRIQSEFDIYTVAPCTPFDHWNVFKDIATSSTLRKNKWTARTMFFSKEWFEHTKDPKWTPFYYYIMQQHWQQFHYTSWDDLTLLWSLFSQRTRQSKLKPGPYAFDISKHLFMIGYGNRPGFVMNNSRDLYLPANLLEDAYIDVYQLDELAPIIMHPNKPRMRSPEKDEPIYYSINMHSRYLSQSLHLFNNTPSIMTDLRSVIQLNSMLLDTIREYQANLPHKHIQFRYFHNHSNKAYGILANDLIADTNATVRKALNERFNNRKISPYSAFLRGCIEISAVEEASEAAGSLPRQNATHMA